MFFAGFILGAIVGAMAGMLGTLGEIEKTHVRRNRRIHNDE